MKRTAIRRTLRFQRGVNIAVRIVVGLMAAASLLVAAMAEIGGPPYLFSDPPPLLGRHTVAAVVAGLLAAAVLLISERRYVLRRRDAFARLQQTPILKRWMSPHILRTLAPVMGANAAGALATVLILNVGLELPAVPLLGGFMTPLALVASQFEKLTLELLEDAADGSNKEARSTQSDSATSSVHDD